MERTHTHTHTHTTPSPSSSLPARKHDESKDAQSPDVEHAWHAQNTMFGGWARHRHRMMNNPLSVEAQTVHHLCMRPVSAGMLQSLCFSDVQRHLFAYRTILLSTPEVASTYTETVMRPALQTENLSLQDVRCIASFLQSTPNASWSFMNCNSCMLVRHLRSDMSIANVWDVNGWSLPTLLAKFGSRDVRKALLRTCPTLLNHARRAPSDQSVGMLLGTHGTNALRLLMIDTWVKEGILPPSATDQHGWTVAMVLARFGSNKVRMRLLRKWSPVHCQSASQNLLGFNVAMLLATFGSHKVRHMLVQRWSAADCGTHVANGDGMTVPMLLAKLGDNRVRLKMIQKWTAAECCCYLHEHRHHMTVPMLLVQYGSNTVRTRLLTTWKAEDCYPHEVNDDGMNVASMCIHNGSDDVGLCLIRHWTAAQCCRSCPENKEHEESECKHEQPHQVIRAQAQDQEHHQDQEQTQEWTLAMNVAHIGTDDQRMHMIHHWDPHECHLGNNSLSASTENEEGMESPRWTFHMLLAYFGSDDVRLCMIRTWSCANCYSHIQNTDGDTVLTILARFGSDEVRKCMVQTWTPDQRHLETRNELHETVCSILRQFGSEEVKQLLASRWKNRHIE